MKNHTKHMQGHSPRALYPLVVLTLLLFLGQPPDALAQWTTNGSNINNTNPGNVGIGTSTPVSPLEVQAPDAPLTLSQAGVAAKSTIQAAVGTDLHLSANAKWFGGAWSRYDTAAPSWNFFLAGGAGSDYAGLRRTAPGGGAITWTDILRITNTGNIGIGTSAPGYRLHIAGDNTSAGGFPLIKLQNTQAGGRSWWLYSGAANVPGAFGVYDETAGAYRMFFDAAGRVGVGTANPEYPLDVQANTQWAARFKKSDATHGGIIVDSAAGYNPNVALATNGTIKWYMNSNTGNADMLQFWEATGTSPRLTLTQSGNVGIGTSAPTTKLHVVGDLTVTGNISAKYQDVAEWVPSTEELAAGMVVVLDDEHANHVVASTSAYDTKVAGVVSARPGLTLGEAGEHKTLVATTGRVRVKVDATRAPIRIGDLLVTSDVPGMAMKSEPIAVSGRQMHAPGTLIGKALEPLAKGTGEILVLLSLQ